MLKCSKSRGGEKQGKGNRKYHGGGGIDGVARECLTGETFE